MELILEEAIPSLLKGLVVTLKMAAGSLAVGIFLGLLLAAARFYGGRVPSMLATAYGRIMRSVPTVALVLMLYLVIKEIADLSPLAAVIAALGMHSGAYQAEIFRSAIGAVSSGEVKAGQALGMSNWQVFAYVILPQALRNAIPGWSNEVAIVLKETSLGYVVGATEMLRQANYIAARTHQPLLMYSLAGAIYFLLVFMANRVLSYAEVHFRIPSLAERERLGARA